MAISINVHESPLEKSLQEKIISLGMKNNFSLDASALNRPGNYYVVAESEGVVLAIRRFKQHALRSFDGIRARALQACDTLTDKNARGQGLFSKLWGELKLSVMSEYQCTFNFPNDISYPVYLKDGFKPVNSIVTVLLKRSPDILIGKDCVYFDDDETVVNRGNWLKHGLRHGLHKYFPLYSLVNQKPGEEIVAKHAIPRFYSLSANHLDSVHNMRFVKAMLFSSRPVTYFGFEKEFDATNIYLNAACYDTAIR